MSKQWKKVTEKDFEMIKALLNAGLKAGKVIAITGRGAGTVYNISRTNSYDEYLNYGREYRRNMKASTVQGVGTDTAEVNSIVPEKEAIVESAIDDINTNDGYTPAMRELIDKMQTIATNMGRLADAWEATPKRRRLL